ncbi:MAG: NDP-hexose 4-ketoreductase, partial [Planctomycetota bacterium]|nr:NDP-hexose 4-ketoreductase [Planctomycetota bacterium]
FQAPDNDSSYESMKLRVSEQIERVFRPEFLNRLDDTIIFRHLTLNDLNQVVDLELAKVRERLSDRGLQLELTDDAKQFLITQGSNLDFGARPLRRAIENRVEDPLSEELLQGTFEGKNLILVDAVWDDNHEQIVRLDFNGQEVESEEKETVESAVGSTDDEKEEDEGASD